MFKLNIQLHAWQPERIPANVIVSADALPTHMTFSFLETRSLEASAFTRKLAVCVCSSFHNLPRPPLYRKL